MKLKAISQRVFVERDGQICYLDRVTLEELGQENQIALTGYLPRDLDLTFPQTLCLVFQEVADPRTFFDVQQPGMIMVFNNFRVIGSSPIVLLKSQTTGKVTIPTPEFECICDEIHQWVVTNDGVRVTTLRR